MAGDALGLDDLLYAADGSRALVARQLVPGGGCEVHAAYGLALCT